MFWHGTEGEIILNVETNKEENAKEIRKLRKSGRKENSKEEGGINDLFLKSINKYNFQTLNNIVLKITKNPRET